jgi:dipeptidase E
MKLYLSSMDFGDSPIKLAELLGDNKHAALSLNAADFYGDEGRATYLRRFQDDLALLGITSEELDLRKYFGKKDELENHLKKFGLIWTSGGNTFILRSAMKESGLDEILPRLLKDNSVVYGGFSAGACVVCPTLRGIELADDPNEIPPSYPSTIVWDGIGLIDYHIVPHFQSAVGEIDEVVAYYEKQNMKYKTLRDGEVIIVSN